MANTYFDQRLDMLCEEHRELIEMKNIIDETWVNGVYDRYVNPVITRDHLPLFWKYDINPETNPYLMERMGINATLNSGAIYMNGKYHLVVRVEGNDRKSFFAVAESESPVDGFRFWDFPVIIPEAPDDTPATNVYDMRLTQHEDGWIYGLFCVEKHDDSSEDLSCAMATCGIARTKDLVEWERLPDLKAPTQQRNVVLHPEFVDGKYALYTRPQDSFIDAGSATGIGWALVDDITNAVLNPGDEITIEPRLYHTIKESKNGQGATPIKTDKGWLHIAHGVRGCAAGLRYVIYAFMTDLDDPSKVIAAPGGHLISPMAWERVGDVSNVVFINGMIEHEGNLYIYYASSDTRMHVAATSIDKMVDYCMNTPEDPLFTGKCVEQRCELITRNLEYLKDNGIDPDYLR